MRKQALILLILLPFFSKIQGQDQDATDTTNTVKKYFNFADSLFIDRNPTHYSLRVFSSYKDRSFSIQNKSEEVRYTPNNRTGVGIGFANTKITIDLGINIKSNDDVTERFDFDTDLTLDRATIGLSIQHYKGYNLETSSTQGSIFREDISSLSVVTSYVRLFNSDKLSMGSIINGVSRQKKSAYSFGYGGVVAYNRTNADSSIVNSSVPGDFNPYAEITNMQEIGIAAVGQINGVLVLPFNLFLTSSFVPAIGLNYKGVETETIKYNPKEPLVYSLAIRTALGFNFDRFYTLFSYNGIYGSSSLGFDNRSKLRSNKLKFVIGYKLFNEKASSNN